jgi:hypothetical protein
VTPRHRLSRKGVAALPVRSPAEILLGVQLEQAGIPFEAEYRFHPSRKWRADFRVEDDMTWPFPSRYILVEIDGGAFIPGGGRHSRGAGVEKDAEKQSAAAILGYRVIRATPHQVEDGRCLAWIRQALGLEAAA